MTHLCHDESYVNILIWALMVDNHYLYNLASIYLNQPVAKDYVFLAY